MQYLLSLTCLLMIAGQTTLGQTDSSAKSSQVPVLHVYYSPQDPSYRNVTMRLPELRNTINELELSLSSTQRTEDMLRQMEGDFEKIDFSVAAQKAKSAARRTVEDNSCENIDFEQAGFTVNRSRIEDPFDFLPWVRVRQERAIAQIAALVDGKPFRYATASGQALKIIEDENFLPDTSDVRVKLRVELVSVENCSDRKLDLVYRIYSSQIMPVLSSVPEARVTERQSPQTAAGQTTVEVPLVKPYRFTPLAGYDASDKLHGGGQFEFQPKKFSNGPINSIIVKGDGSDQFHILSAALAGSNDSSGWLVHSDWRLDYSHHKYPTGSGPLQRGQLSAQFSSISKPLVGGNITFRFGGLLEAGNRQSNINTPLTSDTVPDAGFGSIKVYAGLNSRLRRHVFSVSYGLQLGSVGPAFRIDWRKHIGDIRHEFWYPLGNHRILNLESRFTIGRIQVPGKIPLGERFFGGNNEEFFLPNDSWQIRANPVIRAIPGSSFYRTIAGAGGERFFSYNLTAAYTVWRRPLVPLELSQDEEFNGELEESIETVTGTLQNYQATKDEHYQSVKNILAEVTIALGLLKSQVTTSQQAHQGQFEAEFQAALRTVNTAIRRAQSAGQETDAVEQYGTIRALLSPSEDVGENRLAKAITATSDLIKALGGDSSISSALAEIDRLRNMMETEFKQIDQIKAQKIANEQMAFTRRALSTLFNDVNIVAISPVVVFDIARLSGEIAGIGGVRYGPGAGIRLEFASTANITGGYAWNVKRGLDERRGTIFFSIGVRDLFR